MRAGTHRTRGRAAERPAFAGPIPIYHGDEGHGGRGPSQMTHVWLTDHIVSAWSNCLPVGALQHANPALRYTRPASDVSGPEARPC